MYPFGWLAWLAWPPQRPNGKLILAEKKSLGLERECNRQKKVAYVLHFWASKSIWLESGDNRFCVFAYLTALLGGHFLIFAYLTALLAPRFQLFCIFLIWRILAPAVVRSCGLGRLWGAKMAQDGAKMAQDGAVMFQDGASWHQIGAS